MIKKPRPRKSASSKWFAAVFLSFSMVFCLVLVPLCIYLQNTFSDLELEKFRKQLATGTAQLEAVANGMLNVSQALNQDSRFLICRYAHPDYSSVDIATRRQMRNTFQGLMAAQPLVKDSALQFEQNVVITPYSISFQDRTVYYPDFFQCGQLDYIQWVELLRENRNGFLPVQHIRTNSQEYNAVIYALRWTETAYLYACIDVADLKKALVEPSGSDGSYITLIRSDGEVLYSDLPESETGYRTLSDSTSIGGLQIEVHIPNHVFIKRMQPAYLFIGLYALACLVLFIGWVLIGTHVSSKPIRKIISVLEKSSNLQTENVSRDTAKHGLPKTLWEDFDRITDSIVRADRSISQYRSTIDTQQEILQARFFEKAIAGRLGAQEDIARFCSYFPAFPEEYRLLMLNFKPTAPDPQPPICAGPLLIVQSFLKSVLPGAYLQQFSDTDLLLLISEDDYDSCSRILNFMIANINREEPLLAIRCVASDSFQRLEDLPLAYRQLQDLECCSFADSAARICTAADQMQKSVPPFHMTDLQTLYTAVTYGNEPMAMSKLEECSMHLAAAQNSMLPRHIYDLISAMLICVKLEHPSLLASQEIPSYRAQESLYGQLAPVVRSFCQEIHRDLQPGTDPFAAELLQYIDQHFMEYSLCLNSLGQHFNCSVSKLQKAVKSATGITIANYIEKKRMEKAVELLAKKQKPVAQIAAECGFASTNSFYKAFKRSYGKAPTENLILPET